jgi:GNAT superfamily N-acetyltransferase
MVPVPLTATPVPVTDILPWREDFRREMACQIVHDSLHDRTGWTQSYLLASGGVVVGYGAVAIGGPWQGTKTVFEFYLAPAHHGRAFDFFEAFLLASATTHFEFQTSATLLNSLAHVWSQDLRSEHIVFHDRLATRLPANGSRLSRASPDSVAKLFTHQHEPIGDWLLELDGTIIATGGVLDHYNPPYGDIYMEVAEPYQRRGFGAYLVQELKRISRENGMIPCARCSTTNIPSRRTLQKAGFVPCAHILTGTIKTP